MNIETNLTYNGINNIGFSSFEDLYKFMCEDNIQKVYIKNTIWWGINFIGTNGWYTQEDIYNIIN